MAMKENKTQGKEGEDKRVFLGFRDDAAVNPHRHSAAGKVRVQSQPVPHILDVKITYRLRQQTRTRPRRRLPYVTPIVETAAHPNANVIGSSHIVHEHPINSSADGRRANGDGRRVRRIGGKSDVGAAAAGNALSDGIDVDGIRAGKERRERDLRVGRRVGVVNVAGRLPAVGARIVA